MPKSSISLSTFTNGLSEGDGRLPCVIGDCGKLRLAHGYCERHYTRFRRHGSPYVSRYAPVIYSILDSNTIQIPLRDNRGAVVSLTTVDACDAATLCRWRWFENDNGYAQRGRGKVILMARFILGIVDQPHTVQADHINRNRLDNRRSNLRVVTPLQNSANRVLPQTKLKPEEVRAIRRRQAGGETHLSLAIEFNVSRSQIGRIVNRKDWRHL